MPKNGLPTQEQYSHESLTRYEWIFGKDFLSSGAPEVASHAAKALDLRPGARVLDIGSGLGGAAFFFAEAYSAQVTGLDVLPQMHAEAQRRGNERNIVNVAFILGDVLSVPLPAAQFDAVYSKDSFLHIQDKQKLMQTLFRLVAPGGRIFFTDYLRGRAFGSQEFETYAADSQYSLATVEQYVEQLRVAGFQNIVTGDWSERLTEILREDIAKLRACDSVLATADVDYLIDRWELKLRCLHSGDMKWGSFEARRVK
ncbi:MAG: methyltransferase domain-containing protein [Candidatus Hydrogenedentes bacterium]|nr:methyltransferase domain-containing protein [Candidatus Hydrogenedentota bacterium]